MKTKLKKYFDEFFKILSKPEIGILPGHLTFSFFMAVVPTLSLITYSTSIFNISNEYIYSFLSKIFSPEIASLLIQNDMQGSGIKLLIMLIIAYFISSNGTASIITTSNMIYGIKDTDFLKRRIKAGIMNLFLIILFTFMLIFPVFGDVISNLISNIDIPSNVTNNIHVILFLLQSPINWFIIYCFIKLIYTMSPDKKIPSKNTTYGAIFATFGWIIVTYLYSYYVTNIADYSTIYGGLAHIIVLLFWFYLLSYIFIIGMAINFRREENN